MIHFVGAGPGATDLITLRGASLLGEADVVIFAGSLVNPELLSLAPEGCTVHDSSRMTLEQVIDVMAEATHANKDVVRLHTGDPSLYGAIHEQMMRLDELGIPYDDTPGVSSMCAAAASIGAEYTLPGVSQSLIVTRLAGRTPVPETERLRKLAAHGSSMAIFLSAGLLNEVQAELLCGAYDEETPAAIVYKATWPDEHVVRTCVGRLAEDGERAGIRATALILVGDFLKAKGERSRLYDPTFSTGFRGATHANGRATGFSSQRRSNDIALVSFSDMGQELAERLAADLGGQAWRCEPGGLAQWTSEAFAKSAALVFVGATGIAVRAIAPHLRDKATDPAVISVDEQGRFAIPLASGHLGGANDLARRIEEACGAHAIITTATDGRGVFAVDEWARHQGCVVANPERIKIVSAKLLAGKVVRLQSDYPLPDDTPAGVVAITTEACQQRCVSHHSPDIVLSPRSNIGAGALHVVPRVLVAGVGCKRGTPANLLVERLRTTLRQAGYDARALSRVCSIDVKADEPGILAMCAEFDVPFETFSAEELAKTPGSFSSSSFVRDAVGVDNVCERSAVLGSGGGTLVWPKEAGDGITLALAERPFAPDWRWSRG